MRRRQFLHRSFAAVAAAAGTGAWTSAMASTKTVAQEFYELRTYQCPNAAMQKVVGDYLANGLLPALGRQGLQRIGVFTPLPQEDQPADHSIFVLIPYPSLEHVVTQRQVLAGDPQYQEAAADYLAQPLKAPAFSRINSRLMLAFAGMPTMELPPQTATKQPRIFELRIYESHNEDAAARKVEMFNTGEIQLMRDVQLGPVMYGETLIGDNVPNLTYMLSAPDMESHKAHWQTFLKHPEWDQMKRIERYKGTVSKIVNWYLQPTGYSQM
jgi:hypothetical protein